MGTIFTVIAVFIHHVLATRRLELEANIRKQEETRTSLMLKENKSSDVLNDSQSVATHAHPDDEQFLHRWEELIKQFDDIFLESNREVRDSWQQLKERLDASSNILEEGKTLKK